MENRHGGDVYRNSVKYDFSVNINPLGVPENVKTALWEAAGEVTRYPDAEAEELSEGVAELEKVQKEWILFGNGASELFLAIIHALSPKVVTIPVPSFFGYEHAAGAGNGEIRYVNSLNEVKRDTNLLFLANPNNPTGAMIKKTELEKILTFCKGNDIYVVLDECFMDFCPENASLIEEAKNYENVMIIRAFTKIFAIPGVRLGYLICTNAELREKIQAHLPEWNLSCFAQKAGVACTKTGNFRGRTREEVGVQRGFMREKLGEMGVEVVDRWGESQANFLLLRSQVDLYEKMLKKGILIRDCKNFRGLEKGYYRVAIKGREENEIFLKTLKEILEEEERKSP